MAHYGVVNPLLVFIRQHGCAHLQHAAHQFIAVNFQSEVPEDLVVLSQYISLPGPNLFYSAQIQSAGWMVYLLVGAAGVEDARGLSILMANQTSQQNCGRPSDFRHVSILPEMHCFVAMDYGGFLRRCLIYPEFRTLSQWIDEKEANLPILETNLQSLMRDYLLGLYDIHSTSARCHGEISQETLIVYYGKGMFLQPTSLHGRDTSLHGRDRVRTPNEFRNLGDALYAIFNLRAWYQPQTRIHNLIKFVRNIQTIEDCMWVKHAPFILNPRETVNFIPLIQGMSKRHDSFKQALQYAIILWPPAVFTMNHPPLTDGFNEYCRRYRYERLGNYLHLLRFLRNSLAHLNDNVRNPGQGRTRANYSSMRLNASEFMRFISTIEDQQPGIVNVMDSIFYGAVGADCLIENLDFNLLA